MAYSLGGLTAYTNENADQLIAKAVYSGKTISMIPNKQAGIKSAEKINLLAVTPVFQEGGTCTFSASGATAITQRTITVGKYRVNLSWCEKDLEAYYTQKKLAAGSTYDSMAYAEELTNEVLAQVENKMELVAWMGDTGSGDAYLTLTDGFVKIIDAATGVIDATTQADVTTSTVRGIFEDVYSLLPSAIVDKEDVVAFCGWDTFRTLVTKLTTDNLYHYSFDANAKQGELYYPGSTLKVVAVHGLDGTDRIFATRLSNMVYGTDMLNEDEKFELFQYKDGSNEFRLVMEWKAGFQVAFPDQIVSYQNT